MTRKLAAFMGSNDSFECNCHGLVALYATTGQERSGSILTTQELTSTNTKNEIRK